MASEAWKLWRHKEDHSVLYEVQERPFAYECRLAKLGAPEDELLVWEMPKAAFEAVYEPVPEGENVGEG